MSLKIIDEIVDMSEYIVDSEPVQRVGKTAGKVLDLFDNTLDLVNDELLDMKADNVIRKEAKSTKEYISAKKKAYQKEADYELEVLVSKIEAKQARTKARRAKKDTK